jgi:hypothetical protein
MSKISSDKTRYPLTLLKIDKDTCKGLPRIKIEV